MPFEFEALVGHLYIVGGRSINMAPPGALVEVAPKKAARGRETDTFFALVLPSGDAVAPPAFYEQMVQQAAERYFRTSGSVTAGMREVFNDLNRNLTEHNAREKATYEANIVCAVLRGNDLIVGRVGCAIMVLLSGGMLQTFPEDLNDDESLYTEPLGVQPVANIKMSQFRVMEGTRLLLSDEHLAEIGRDQLTGAVMAQDIGTVLVALKDYAKLQMTTLAVEFVNPEVETSYAIPEGESTKEIAEQARQEATKVRQTNEMQAASPRPRRTQKAAKEVQRRTQRGFGVGAQRIAGGLRVTNQMIDHFFGTSDSDRKWFTTPVGAGVVVLLPIIVVTLVVILWLTRTGESEIEICMAEAQNRAELARSLADNERSVVVEAWQAALVKVDECDSLRPGEATMQQLRLEGQSVMDGLNQLTRLNAQLITAIPEAQLTNVIVQEPNLYTMDAANGLIYRVTLSPDGLQATSPPTPLPVRTGGRVDPGFEIGQIIDIAYNFDANLLVAVDRNGVVSECTPNFLQCEAQRLIDWERWQNPIAITLWQQRIYILDTGVGEGQIWRYDKTGGVYNGGPIEYFGGVDTARPSLRSGIDIAIDGGGTVYVLYSEGVVGKWRSAQAQPFSLDNGTFPQGQAITSATAMYLDDSVTAQSLYVVDRSRRTIYETSLIGTFNDSYSVFNEPIFDLLNAVAVVPGDGGTELMYAASGNSVFVLEKG